MAIYTELEIYKAADGLLSVATDYIKNMPRSVKPVLGVHLSKLCINLVLLIARANAARNKVPHLEELLERKTEIEILLRVCRDKQYISVRQYAEAVQHTTSVGKQANGWRNSQRATSPVT